MQPERFTTNTLRHHPRGAEMMAIMAAAVATVDPAAAVQKHLRRHQSGENDWLEIGTHRYDLAEFERVIVLAVGKAATPMALAALAVLGDRADEGLVVPKAEGPESANPSSLGPLTVISAAHPVPDERSLRAGQHAVQLLAGAGEHDLVVVLLSGGGSALMTWPEDDLSLDDMRTLTDALLASGATINEINALRRRCDRVKGGGLLRAAYPAQVAVLVLSDVIGDDLRAIASGPFVAVADSGGVDTIVARYGLHDRLPAHVLRLLERPQEPIDPHLADHVQHTIIGNIDAAVEGARSEAQARGYHVVVLQTDLRGEAREVGAMLARRLLDAHDLPRPCCLIAGGETTVTLRGNGLGGRNQELALSTVELLAEHDDLVLVALATDGGDGPTDAAGAVVSGATLARGQACGLDPRDFLARNDAYHYFAALDDLLRPGQTETNVNDLTLLFAV